MICELADSPGFLCAPAAPSAQKCRKFLQWLNFPQVVDLSAIVRDSQANMGKIVRIFYSEPCHYPLSQADPRYKTGHLLKISAGKPEA